MPRMRAPYTGVVFDVQPENVEKRLARGFALLEPYEQPEPEPEPEEPETDQEPGTDQEPETDAPATDEPKPTADSTIAEIRAWAEAHGIELPAKGNKADLLAAIG